MIEEHVYPTATITSIYYNAGWHNISNDVVSPITGIDGFSGTTPVERVASLGFCSMTLNNATGKYTPGGTGMVDAEWKRGIPIKVDVVFLGVTENVFWGRVQWILLDTSDVGERNVLITAMDYMNIIDTFPLKDKAQETDKRMDEAVQSLLDDLPIAPQNTELSEGISTFPTVFDDIGEFTTAVSEFQKLALSEVSFIYIGRNDTVIAESRDDRKGNREPAKFIKPDVSRLLMEDGGGLLQEDGDDLLLDETESTLENMQGIDMRFGESLINEAYITAFPRGEGEAPEVVFTLDFPAHLTGGKVETYYGRYSDPVGGGDISAIDGIALVATTDYLFNEKKDGSGADYTAFCTITAEYFADAVLFRFISTRAGWVTFLQARATKTYTYSPIEVKASDETSKTSYGVNFISIRQKYQQDVRVSQIEADKIVEHEREPDNEAVSVSFLANSSQVEMLAFLNLGTGDLIHIKEDYNEVDKFYYIYGRTWEITEGRIITFTYTIKHARSLGKGLTELAVEFGGVDSEQAVRFPAVEEVKETTVTIIAEININAWPPAEGTILFLTDDLTVQGTLKFLITGEADKTLQFNSSSRTGEGSWIPNTNILALGVPYVVGVSYDSSSIYNRPLFYLNGVRQKGIIPYGYPIGELKDRLDNNLFFMGAVPLTPTTFSREFDGTIKKVRYYNRMLRASEHLRSVTDVVQEGLIFQAPNVVTKRLADYVDQALGENDGLIDNIFGLVGTPLSSPTGREA